MLLEKLKKIFGVETLDSKLERLDMLKSELDSINANIHNLAFEYTKRVTMREQVMKSGVDQEAITSINTRFSKYEENHLENIFKARKDQIRIKEAIGSIEKSSDVHNHIMNRETIKKAILNGSIDVREYVDIMKSEKGKKKFDYIMREFASGKLKDSSGKVVTSRKQAIAIAYSESGIEKSNEKKIYKDNPKNKELGRENLPYDKENRILEPKKKVIMKAWDLYKEDKINKDVLKLVIEKARSGKYADTPENRRLKRVGKEYGSKKQEDTEESKENKSEGTSKQKEGGGDLAEQAKNASVGELNDAIQHSKNEEVRQAAHAELARREKEEKPQEEKKFGDDYEKDKNIPDKGKSEQPAKNEKDKDNVSADSETKPLKEDKGGASAMSILSILNRAQIPHTRKTSIWGSEYWTVGGERYRISDHDKPSGQIYGGVDIRSFDAFLNELKNRSDLDLSDKSESEKEFKKNAKKDVEKYDRVVFKVSGGDGSIFTSKKYAEEWKNSMRSLKDSSIIKEKETIYKLKSGEMFDSEDSAINYMWRQSLRGSSNEIEKSEEEDSSIKNLEKESLEKEEKNLETDLEKLSKQWL